MRAVVVVDAERISKLRESAPAPRHNKAAVLLSLCVWYLQWEKCLHWCLADVG